MPDLEPGSKEYKRRDKEYQDKVARLKAQDKKDGGHRARDYIDEEQRKYNEMKKHDREVAREQRRRRTLGGSGGRR